MQHIKELSTVAQTAAWLPNIVSHLAVVINKTCSRHKVSNDKVTTSVNKKRCTHQVIPRRSFLAEEGNAALRLRAARKIRAWKPKSRAQTFSRRPLSKTDHFEDEISDLISSKHGRLQRKLLYRSDHSRCELAGISNFAKKYKMIKRWSIVFLRGTYRWSRNKSD